MFELYCFFGLATLLFLSLVEDVPSMSFTRNRINDLICAVLWPISWGMAIYYVYLIMTGKEDISNFLDK